MAKLDEQIQWEDEIYLIEKQDKVLGGKAGVINIQAQQLANRTAFLKSAVDTLGDYAPKDNPAFSGKPTAPTAESDSNDKQLANTEFVRRALIKPTALYDLLIGVPLPWPHHHIPTGCLAMAGQAFDGGRYPKLHERYAGKLPDLRGMFIRGYDNGRGIDLAHALLQEQGDAIRNILGAHVTNTMHAHGAGDDYTAGAFSRNPVALSIPSILTKQPVLSNVSYHEFVTFDASRVVPTAEDNRPRNIAFQYICLAE